MMKGLHVHGVSHAYDGHRVLDNASLTIPAGELVCLLGPSGSGKSTLLRIAAGLERLQHGRVTIDEQVVAEPGTHVPPEDRGVGLMFQDYALFPHLTIIDNVTFGLSHQPRDQAQKRAMEMLEQVDMEGHAGKHPHMLSGGQQQRVALARALAPEPRLVLLDEPFSGLDTSMRAKIREDTLSVLKQSGIATLMVTHDPEEAMFMADRILVMSEGRVVQDGTPVETYFHPEDPFVAGFFGQINRLAGVVTGGHVKTPLGAFDASNIAEGQAVEVLIRPEGLRLAEAGVEPTSNPGDAPYKPAPPAQIGSGQNHQGFKVVSARPLGGASLVVFVLLQPNGKSQLIEARVPGVFLPTPGSQITVSVNANEAYVFKTD